MAADPYFTAVANALPQSSAPATPYAQSVGNYFDPPQPAATSATPPPPPPPAAAPAGPPQMASDVYGPQFNLRAVGGSGVTPAHEVDLRGPTLRNQQGVSNDTFAVMAQEQGDRTQERAMEEAAMYAEQARQAKLREDAMMRAQAEREEEMLQRQQDFDTGVKAMSKASVDPERFWASRSTGQKIAGTLSIALGGFLQGAKGGSNPGMDLINTQIERDIKAQEFGYQASRDTVNARQTAFGMAMQKYNNADAARAMARAAAIDATQAQVGQMGALWKDTNAGNHANNLMAELEQMKTQQIAQGVKFILPQSSGRTFVDPRTGLRYSEAEAKVLDKEIRGQQEARSVLGLKTAGDILTEQTKGGKEHTKQTADEARAVSSQLQQAGVPQARAAAEMALKALNVSEGGLVEGVARQMYPGATRLVAGEDRNAREQAYANFSNAAIKAMMGNATESEVARAEAALGTARDPESRKRAIKMTLDTLEQIEKNAKAGASPEAQAEFDRRRQNAEGGPASAPKGSKAGW